MDIINIIKHAEILHNHIQANSDDKTVLQGADHCLSIIKDGVKDGVDVEQAYEWLQYACFAAAVANKTLTE